ncbi:MAG: hypothetical protein WAT22_11690 [Saprospiraceae bacterium]|nr:hypothetical protein [Saprospiraceae bacterium]
MKTNLFKIAPFLILFAGLFITSCTESDDTSSASLDEYAEETVLRTIDSVGVGRKGCFELVFPVTVVFGDSSTATADSYEAMKDAIKAWREKNPDSRIRPKIALPFQVVKPDGEYVNVTTDAEAKALKAMCGRPGHGPKGPKGNHKMCFKPVFPFTVLLPDGKEFTLTSSADRKALHDAIKAYYTANPGAARTKPTLKFPATFEMSDGTKVTVKSKEELIALKDSCN